MSLTYDVLKDDVRAGKLGDEENGPASFAVRCTFRVFARSIYKALGEVVA